MTQEDKQLLLVDLCARLPYGVKAQYYGSEEEMLTVDTIEAIYAQPSIEIIIGQYGLEIEDVKPYLRPMSSMTEEEKRELQSFFPGSFDGQWLNLEKGYIDIYECESTTRLYLYDATGLIEWLNKKMFDFRGLIKKGLAIEVTENNNPYKD